MARSEVRNDIKLLASRGVSMIDVFSRFGSILYKSSVIQANEFLEELANK